MKYKETRNFHKKQRKEWWIAMWYQWMLENLLTNEEETWDNRDTVLQKDAEDILKEPS